MFRGEIEKKERKKEVEEVGMWVVFIKGRWSLDAQLREASGLTPGSDEIVFLITCLLY